MSSHYAIFLDVDTRIEKLGLEEPSTNNCLKIIVD